MACLVNKLSSIFNTKTQKKKDLQHDPIYYAKYPKQSCREGCTVETGRRMSEPIADHSRRDKALYLFEHSIKKDCIERGNTRKIWL